MLFRLTKMLKGEMPIHIDDAFKRELEQSIIGHSPKDDNRYWDDFRLAIDFKEDFLTFFANSTTTLRRLRNFGEKKRTLSSLTPVLWKCLP